MKDMIIIETERLKVRMWQEEDFDDFYKVMSNSKTHLYTSGGPWTVEKTKNMINWNMENTDISTGIFNFPLIKKEGNKVIGRVGLNPYDREKNIPEIEWTLGVDFWNNGYATEIGMGILNYGFEEAGFSMIIGFSNPSNKGSLRVMEKIGMKFVDEKQYRDHMYRFYEITKEEYLKML